MANRTLTDTASVTQDVSVAGQLKLTAKPSGSTLQIQYNNAGAFGGIAGSSWDGTDVTFPNLTIGAVGAKIGMVNTDSMNSIGLFSSGFLTLVSSHNGNHVRVGSGGSIGWSSQPDPASGISDTGFSRLAAGIAALGNASAADISGSLKLTDLFTNNTAFLIRAGVALANAAAAATATLTNSPVAGNPTKWISIDDAGTTRRIPAW